MSIHAEVCLGPVHYTVTNLSRQIEFYCDVLGFHVLRQEGSTAVLGGTGRSVGSTELLHMTEVPDAPRRRGTTGLYHTAFLVPTQWHLAHLVRRLIDTRTPVQGHSNHGTHLAVYLPDPEGNGIELAWDFPKEQWPMRNGQMVPEDMPREGIDLEQLLSKLERDPAPWRGMPGDAAVGHVHLHVSDLDSSRRFYHELLGFDISMDGRGMGALFVSAGGYHHHVGMNVWKGVGLPAPPADAAGLRHFTVVLSDEHELDRMLARVRQADVRTVTNEDGVLLRDPSGNGLMLTVG